MKLCSEFFGFHYYCTSEMKNKTEIKLLVMEHHNTVA